MRPFAQAVHCLALDAPRKRLFAGYQVHQLLTHENPDFLLSGGDSGTIKLWQLPHGSVLTPWSVHPPTQQFEGSSGCSRPAESDMRFGAEEDEQEEQPEDAGRHGEWVVNAASRNRNPALLRRYSSGSDDDEYAPQHQQQQLQQEQQQQQQEEPPLLVQHQEQDSSDDELDDIRSALA
ncbi:uncharacterized protein DDB_G0283357 [Cyclospora cayetanensis]|uniref:Uncharacterized protein DDB_G0283357 n=1 Tax=Cyclospora cayetanensis TaxID=88456 RepID=A0A6P6RU12_9EIME|nr:uncharacterized protein DDB_G0283357 [Cyclospora cayetanensis]